MPKILPVAAIIGAALMIVSTSVPTNAFSTAQTSVPTDTTARVANEVQSIEWAPQASAAVGVTRDEYSATSLKEQISLLYGDRPFLYTPDSTGAIQWPFAFAVPISSGYGPRAAPCSDCSTFHHGVDFLPGAGTPIGVIADGVVVRVNDIDWSYGQHVLVQHVIDGTPVQSLYAHMAMGSLRVNVGQPVTAGEVVGLVGNTGQSVGPHLHLEIRISGEPIDAFAWLQQNAR